MTPHFNNEEESLEELVFVLITMGIIIVLLFLSIAIGHPGHG